jgi:hypothetical protein
MDAYLSIYAQHRGSKSLRHIFLKYSCINPLKFQHISLSAHKHINTFQRNGMTVSSNISLLFAKSKFAVLKFKYDAAKSTRKI